MVGRESGTEKILKLWDNDSYRMSHTERGFSGLFWSNQDILLSSIWNRQFNNLVVRSSRDWARYSLRFAIPLWKWVLCSVRDRKIFFEIPENFCSLAEHILQTLTNRLQKKFFENRSGSLKFLIAKKTFIHRLYTSVKPFKSKNRDKIDLDAPNPNLK